MKRLQNTSDRELYTYVNFERKGKLVDAYNRAIKDSARFQVLNCFIRDEIAQFLYNGGNGSVVSSKRNAFAPKINVSTDNNATLFSTISYSRFFIAF